MRPLVLGPPRCTLAPAARRRRHRRQRRNDRPAQAGPRASLPASHRPANGGHRMTARSSSNIFADLTVLSLEQATVLPYLTYRLAQDGVRVIRLEHPKFCDPNRMIGHPFVEGEDRMCSYFFALNCGKEAVTLNLKDPRAQELLKRMIVELDVDVFATNQLPKNYAPLGVDYETLSALKPDLIWLGVTGFGPDSNEAAYDPILQARGGLMDLTGEAGGDPQVVGIPLPDMGTSEHAYGQLMKALYKRALTGEGSRIDMAMIDSTTSWLTQPVTMARTFGRPMTRRGNTHEFFGPVSVFPTTDGFVYIALGNDAQWQRRVGPRAGQGHESLPLHLVAQGAG